MNLLQATVLGVATALAALSPARAEQTRYKVAILKIRETAGEVFQDPGMRRRQMPDLQEACERTLREFLIREGRFIVSTAADRDKILPDLDPYDGLVPSPAEAAKAGRALGVDYVLLADENVVIKQYTGGGTTDRSDVTSNVTLRVLKSADGSEVFGKTMPEEADGPLLSMMDSPDGRYELRRSSAYSIERAVASFRKAFLKSLPIQGKIVAIQDAQKRVVTLDFGGSLGATKGIQFEILNAKGGVAGELVISDVTSDSSTAKFKKGSETAAVVGAVVRSVTQKDKLFQFGEL